MHRLPAAIAAALLVTSCGQSPAGSGPVQAGGGSGTPAGPVQSSALRWDLSAPDGASVLALLDGSGAPVFRIICAKSGGSLAVNVPSFQPIGSEERLSFGSGGTVVALVADTSGDAERGGVTGEGAAPAELRDILSGPVSASYGSQVSGPHPVPPADLAAAELAACTAPAGAAAGPAPRAAKPASACLTQDNHAIDANRLRAVGTEPFWGARIEGRCVTYLTPDDQSGTRVWTRFSGSRDAGTWVGALNGKPFELRTAPSPSCSDGMSDKSYPVKVTLAVNGETRSGCAEPL